MCVEVLSSSEQESDSLCADKDSDAAFVGPLPEIKFQMANKME